MADGENANEEKTSQASQTHQDEQQESPEEPLSYQSPEAAIPIPGVTHTNTEDETEDSKIEDFINHGTYDPNFRSCHRSALKVAFYTIYTF